MVGSLRLGPRVQMLYYDIMSAGPAVMAPQQPCAAQCTVDDRMVSLNMHHAWQAPTAVHSAVSKPVVLLCRWPPLQGLVFVFSR